MGREKAETRMTDDNDPTDRRGEPRSTLVYRPLLVEAEQFVGFCLAKNISSLGMMGRFYTHCSVGAPVKVHFNDFHATPGSIAWSNYGAIGVKFDTLINVEEILALLSQPRQRGKVSRAPRLPIEVKGDIICEGRTVPVEVINISQKGVKLRSPFLSQGDDAVVKIGGLEPRRAIVKWAKDGVAGLNFPRPLNFDQLGKWAAHEQMGEISAASPETTSDGRRKV